jgi:hypothetical protein
MTHADTTVHAARAKTPSQFSLDEYWMPFTPNRDFRQDPKMVVRAEGMYRGTITATRSRWPSGCFASTLTRPQGDRGRRRRALWNRSRSVRAATLGSSSHDPRRDLPGDQSIFSSTRFRGRHRDEGRAGVCQARGQGYSMPFPGSAYHGVIRRRVVVGPGQQPPCSVRPSWHRPHASHAPQGNFFAPGEGAQGVEHSDRCGPSI